MRSLIYFIKESIYSIITNRLMSFASVGILCSCLILMGSAMLIVMNINSFVDKFENKVVVFIDESMDDYFEDIGFQIRTLDNAGEVIPVTKKEAYERMKKMLGDLIEGLPDDTFRNSYEITVKDIARYDEMIYQLNNISGIVNMQESKESVDFVLTIRRLLAIIGVWIVGILIGVSIFIISNTTKLAMETRKEEIGIMKNVGATDWFIRWPFIIEGFILGLFAGAVAFIMTWYVYDNVLDSFVKQIDIITIIPFSEIYKFVVVSFCAVGIVVGVLGSLLSIRKHLY